MARWKNFITTALLCTLPFLAWLSPPGNGSTPAVTPYSAISSFGKLDRLYHHFVTEHEATGGDTDVTIFLAPSRAYSDEWTKGKGVAHLDLISGRVSLSVEGLDADDLLSAWLVDNQPGEGMSAQPEEGDRLIALGALRFEGGKWISRADLGHEGLSHFDVDQVVVTRRGQRPWKRGLLFGSPSLFQRAYTRHRLGRGAVDEPALPRHPRGLFPQAIAQGAFPTFDALVLQGADLFLNETFDGNGRTCATCHPPENNFTIDPAFIATLPADDPLFVAENDPALAVGFEEPAMMRGFGLILENVDGFDTHTLRSVSHTLAMSRSLIAPPGFPHAEATGWGGDGSPGGTLREFANGAIQQHAPRTLNREAGVDFRFATDVELDALEAFQLFLGREDEPDTEAMLFTDPFVANGRDLFNRVDSSLGRSGKCVLCHANGGANREPPFAPTSVNVNADTRVQDLSSDLIPPDGGLGTEVSADPTVIGLGDGTFNTPPLIEAADTAPFFHNNVMLTIEEAVLFYSSTTFAASPAAENISVFDDGTGITLITEDSIPIGAFLRVLNALENIRSAQASILFAKENPGTPGFTELLQLARFEIEDAEEVLLPPAPLPVLHAPARADLSVADLAVSTAIVDSAAADALLAETFCLLESAKAEMVSNSIADCDNSGVSDQCEFILGLLEDCDGSGLADLCEIEQGLLLDCNDNLIPDICEGPSGSTVDTTPPLLLDVPANLLAEVAPGTCSAAVTWTNPTAIDDCGFANVEASHEPNSLFPLGITTVSFTATDLAGNSTVASFTISVIDTELPEILGVPEDVFLTTDPGTCTAIHNWVEPIAVDNCGMSAFSANVLSGTTFPLGSTVVEFSAIDIAGNSLQRSFTITVSDLEAPDITLNTPIISMGDPITCSASVVVPSPFSTDGCGVVVLTNDFTGTSDASGIYPVGTTNVIWSATDQSGNIATASQEITVEVPPGSPCFSTSMILGDCGGEGSIGLGDAIIILGFLFQNAATPPCLDACDLNQNGFVTLGDAVTVLGCLFSTCAVDVSNTCAPDPSPQGLSCEVSPCP